MDPILAVWDQYSARPPVLVPATSPPASIYVVVQSATPVPPLVAYFRRYL